MDLMRKLKALQEESAQLVEFCEVLRECERLTEERRKNAAKMIPARFHWREFWRDALPILPQGNPEAIKGHTNPAPVGGGVKIETI